MTRSNVVCSFWISLLVLGCFTLVMLDRHDGERDARHAREGAESFARPHPYSPKDVARGDDDRRGIGDGESRRIVDPVESSASSGRPSGRPSGRLGALSRRGLALLRSVDPRRRCRGVEILESAAEVEPGAVEGIRGAIRDSNSRVRLEAVQALIDVEDRVALPELRELLHDAAPTVRGEVIGALVELGGEPESAAIAELLADPDPDVRADAASALASLRSCPRLDLLLAALKDPDAEVRDQAAVALDRLRTPPAIGRDGRGARLRR